MRLILFFLFAPLIIQAQTKNCSSTFIEKKYKDAIRPYLDDDYELESTDYFGAANNQKSEFKKAFDSDFEYVILIITPIGTSVASIEILDKSRTQQEFEKETLQLESDLIDLEFVPNYDGTYSVISSMSCKSEGSNCTILAILKREPEPEPNRRK